MLFVDAEIAGRLGLFIVGIGIATEARFCLRIGNAVGGLCLPVSNRDLESFQHYHASGHAIIEKSSLVLSVGPTRHGIPSSMETYRSRGHRRLSKKAYGRELFVLYLGR